MSWRNLFWNLEKKFLQKAMKVNYDFNNEGTNWQEIVICNYTTIKIALAFLLVHIHALLIIFYFTFHQKLYGLPKCIIRLTLVPEKMGEIFRI